MFLNIFAGLILVYSYILMSRVDASRKTLEHNSKIDPLTGLMNRAALIAEAERMLIPVRKGKEQLVIMFADLDKFKAINDSL